jgi:hypothetical protein
MRSNGALETLGASGAVAIVESVGEITLIIGRTEDSGRNRSSGTSGALGVLERVGAVGALAGSPWSIGMGVLGAVEHVSAGCTGKVDQILSSRNPGWFTLL